MTESFAWAIAPLVLACFWQVVNARSPAVELVTDRAVCSTSLVNYIRCTLQQPPDRQELPYISGVRLRWEDGSQRALCVGIKSRGSAKARRSSNSTKLSYKTIELAAADAVYGIRVCYDRPLQHVVGLMFTAASGQYVCGNIWRYPQSCVTSRTLLAAPLSHIEASCQGGVLNGIAKVCWNRYYTPQELHYVCPAGQGVAKGASYCKPCLANTFNPGGINACAPCPKGQVTSWSGSSSCGCPAGHGYDPVSQQCEVCPQGTYSPGGALNPCIGCPYPFMASARGSAAIEDCLCQPGYGYSTAVSSCAPCARNSYSDGVRSDQYITAGIPTFQPCTDCPEGTRTLKPQAISADRCK